MRQALFTAALFTAASTVEANIVSMYIFNFQGGEPDADTYGNTAVVDRYDWDCSPCSDWLGNDWPYSATWRDDDGDNGAFGGVNNFYPDMFSFDNVNNIGSVDCYRDGGSQVQTDYSAHYQAYLSGANPGHWLGTCWAVHDCAQNWCYAGGVSTVNYVRVLECELNM